jgi:hypothetical protein
MLWRAVRDVNARASGDQTSVFSYAWLLSVVASFASIPTDSRKLLQSRAALMLLHPGLPVAVLVIASTVFPGRYQTILEDVTKAVEFEEVKSTAVIEHIIADTLKKHGVTTAPLAQCV